jgi:hypothetical protein
VLVENTSLRGEASADVPSRCNVPEFKFMCIRGPGAGVNADVDADADFRKSGRQSGTVGSG